MSRNIVFIMDVDIKGDGRYASSRREAYKYSIDSWKKWCDKNNCELFILNDLLLPNNEMGICWLRYYLFDIFDDYMMDWYKYFDCGFIIVNQNHKELFKSITDFYHNNSQNLIKMQETYFGGTDQTPVNMLINKLGIDYKLLPYEFNMNDMNRKELYGDDLLFTKVGWIYQYNAIPNNKDNQLTNHFMKKTYEHFYGELND